MAKKEHQAFTQRTLIGKSRFLHQQIRLSDNGNCRRNWSINTIRYIYQLGYSIKSIYKIAKVDFSTIQIFKYYFLTDRHRPRKFSIEPHDQCRCKDSSNDRSKIIITCNRGSAIMDYKTSSFKPIQTTSAFKETPTECNIS